MKNTIPLLLLAASFLACETVVDTKLDPAAEIVVIDAWINQKEVQQRVYVTRSQPYFESSKPQKIPAASVMIEDLTSGDVYDFVEGADYYYWDPGVTTFGTIGNSYKLSVTIGDETFESYTTMARVPPIDSIKFNYKEADFLVDEEYYTAEFLATDPVGVGDAYWIKTWKNDTYLGRPSELNIAFDAGFTPSQSVDGQLFNVLIRRDVINPYDERDDGNGQFYPPFTVGDSVHVEIQAISHSAFDFLWAVFIQTNRPGGPAELFSQPLANVPTNLKSLQMDSPSKVAGFFNVGAVSSDGLKLTQALADEAKLQAQ